MSVFRMPSSRRGNLAFAVLCVGLTASFGAPHLRGVGSGWSHTAMELLATVLGVAAGAVAILLAWPAAEPLVEAVLEQEQRELKARVAAARQELAEQDQLAALASRIGVALTRDHAFEASLQ